MTDSCRQEIDRNYDFFQRNLQHFLPDHSGQFALLKNGALIAFHPSIGDAYRDGLKRFNDAKFSIQEVSDDIVKFGHMSVALD